MTITQLPPFAPETQIPEYDFDVEPSGVVYRLRLRWFERLSGWYMSLWDSDGEAMILGKRMMVDTPLLWRHTGRRPAGGFLVLVDTSGTGDECAYNDLGHRCELCWITDDEFDEREAPEITIEIPT